MGKQDDIGLSMGDGKIRPFVMSFKHRWFFDTFSDENDKILNDEADIDLKEHNVHNQVHPRV